MDLQLTGRSAIVLASTKGLGKATAIELAKEGANVTICGRNQEALIKVSEEIQGITGKLPLAIKADLGNSKDISNLVAQTVAKFGTVDILIANSGGPPAGRFGEISEDLWQEAFNLSLFSYIRAIKAVLPHMQKQEFGRIVNFASSSFKQPIEGLILSNTFRTALLGLSKTLSIELGGFGILINTVGPGRIETDRVAELDNIKACHLGLQPEDIRKLVVAQIPVGRYGHPSEFAQLVAFLASPINTYITGQSLLVDGGMVKAL